MTSSAPQPPDDGDFRAVFRASPDILLLLTPDFQMVDATDARLAATLTRREDVVGKPLFEVFPDNPDNEAAAGQKNLRASLETVLATRKPHEMALQRYDLVRPDGTFEERYWRPLNVPVLGADGAVRFILHRVEDATPDVQRRRDQAMAARIVDHAPAGISYLDRHLVYGWVNPAWCALTGLPAGAFIGRSVFEAFGPGAEAQIGAVLRGVLATGEPATAAAFPFAYAVDGVTRQTYWDLTCEPVRADDGSVEGLLTLALEVSDRVSRDDLQAERMAALEQADRAKDQFLGILSHELRTPINAILGFGSVLADEVAGPMPDAQRRYVGKILDSADDLLELVDDLLDMSRVQAGKFALDRQPVEVGALARETLAGLAATAAARELALVDAMPPALPTLQADPRRVKQILDNLVTNAIKYTPAGGTITVRAGAEGDGIRVEVADTGNGVAREQQARIFQAFTQVDMTNTRAKGGVGLGLSIVKALVEAHGGTAGVESAGEGQGSCFYFTLPAGL